MFGSSIHIVIEAAKIGQRSQASGVMGCERQLSLILFERDNTSCLVWTIIHSRVFFSSPETMRTASQTREDVSRLFRPLHSTADRLYVWVAILLGSLESLSSLRSI